MKALAITLFVFASFAVYGQTSLPIEYSYDSAGNRVARRVVEMRIDHPGSRQNAQIITSDTMCYDMLLHSNGINIFPNPTNGIVTIESTHYETEIMSRHSPCIRVSSKAVVYDGKGQLLFEKSIDNGTIKLDLSSYPVGYYFIDISIGNERSYWKIIKM